MAKKPSYKDLEQKIIELELEVLLLKEYKNKAEELHDKESRYRAVIENQTEMICCFQPDGTITFVNEAYCRYFNKNREELIGHKFFPLIPDDDREEVFGSVSNLSPNKPIVTLEHRVLAPNGEICWHKWTNRAIFDNQNKLTEYQAVGWDITERKHAEEALWESESKLNAMLASIGDHVSMIDKDLNILWANETAKKVFGNNIVGKKCYEVFHQREEPCDPYPCFTLRAFQDGEIHENYVQVIDKYGETIFFHCIANVALRDKEGNPTSVIEISREITDRVKAEKALQEAHKALELEFEKRSQKLSDTLKKMEQKEQDLIQHKSDLQKLNKEIIETNRALSVLARNIDKNKEIFEKKIYETITVKILPIIKDLKNNDQLKSFMADLDVLETNLNSLFTGLNHHHEIIHSLTDQEMRVASLIKRGMTNQKVSKLLNISEHTVKTHRKNIRKKLKIKNSNINLTSYLKSNMPPVSM